MPWLCSADYFIYIFKVPGTVVYYPSCQLVTFSQIASYTYCLPPCLLQARLQIIRADPATYECEPSPPPPHSSVHSYADWRAAYFDEATCQPRPGIPLSDIRDPSNEDRSPDSLLEPPHPSPEELLDQYPFMRTYLTQLVHVEGQPGGKGLTDADFWSRYYYRVWLLDVTERRRQKLAERIASTTTLKGPDSVDAKNRSTPASSEVDKPDDKEDNDWFGK